MKIKLVNNYWIYATLLFVLATGILFLTKVDALSGYYVILKSIAVILILIGFVTFVYSYIVNMKKIFKP